MSKKFVYIALFIALIFVSLSSSAASETNNVNITDASEYDIDVSNAHYAEVIEETNEAQSNIENKNNINSEIWVSPDGVGDGSTQDNPSNLTYALENIKENSIIYVLDGEYTTSRTYGIDVDNIIIKSVNPDSVIFYKNYYSFFDVKANNFMLEGITFLSSRSGEDVINWYGENGTVKDCNFINLTSSAIMAYETASNLKILNSNFINNTRYKNTVYIGAPNFVIDGCKFIGHNDIGPNAVLQGGAIYCDSPNGTIINSEFYNNEASWLGGAIFYSNFVNASIINCTFFNNSAGVDGFGGDGGAIYFELSNNSNIINCTFVNNSINDGTGGAIEGYSGEYTNIINCTFIGNKCGYDSDDDEYGGAVCWDVYNGTIMNSVFINNIAENGGALNLFYAHGTTVKNCTFINNTARTLYGGAIYSKGKDTTITNCTFIENTADFGGAIFVDTHAFNNTLSDLVFINNYGRVGGAVYWWDGTKGLLNNSIFINNTGEKGGAIYIRNTNVLVNNCIIVNSSAEFGGAIYIHGDSVNTTIKDSLFINNSAITSGGASYDVGENTTYNNCDFIGNNAVYGAIYTKSLNGVITDCNFINNTAKYGGAIYVNALNYVIENSNIINNTATAYGGAIYVGSSSENTRINNVKFENNSAAEYGGAIEYLGSNGVIANSTFVNNNALYAGAIDLDCDNVTVIDSIFDSNSAEYGGSIIVFGSSSLISSEFTGDYADVGQSIYNEGELYLKDNIINSEFASIYNEGLITSPVTVVVLNNSTVYVHKGDKFNLSAVLVDDNNNRIIGGNLSLIIENQTFSSVNYTPEGEYIIEYSINKTGKFPASGSYGNGTDVSIKNGMIVTYLNADLDISIDDIYYGNSFQINVSLKDEDGNNLSDIVSVIINGKEYLVPVTNGVGSLVVSDILDANKYQANSEYNGQNHYAVSNTTFNVLPIDPELSIVVNDTDYGEDVVVDVFLDGINGTGLTGTVTVEIDGKNYTVSVTDGYGSFIISDVLNSENYTANVFFNGSIDYNGAVNSTIFDVSPVNPELSIVVNDTDYGEDVVVDVFLNGINGTGLTGTVTIELNNKNYTLSITDGYGSLIVPDALNSGNYTASVIFNGTNNYNKVISNTTFTVNKIVENITDDNETTDIDNETSTDIDEDTTPDKEDSTESASNQENYQKDSNLLSSDNINKGISMSKTGIPILALLLLLICAPLVLRKK